MRMRVSDGPHRHKYVERTPAASRFTHPCARLGGKVGSEPCTACGRKGQTLDHRACTLHGKCTVDALSLNRLACCLTCEDKVGALPARVVRLGLPGLAFNPSIVEHRGRTLLAWRNAHAGSRILLCEVDREFRPRLPIRQLALNHPLAGFGQEDPRLFVHAGRLHVQYSGVQGASWQDGVNVLHALLRDDLTVERTWEPALEGRQDLEKNWAPFEHGGELWSVYKPGPHKHEIVRHVGDRAERCDPVPWRPRWAGDMRGGAAPVLHGGEWWHFFHGWERRGDTYSYSCGVYTFEDRPPFRPKRILPLPILRTREPHVEVHRGDVKVVFPGGAILRNGRWLVAYGHRDCECLIAEFDHADLEQRMVNV